MPIPKSDYISEVWKDGIFGKFAQRAKEAKLGSFLFICSCRPLLRVFLDDHERQ